MMTGKILTPKVAYRPDEEISGTVSWTAEKSPKTAELRLFWHTVGKGDRDNGIAENLIFEMPQPTDARPFSFRAPTFPPSFSGNLISLIWGLELILDPGGAEALELVIGPDAQEVTLDHPDWLIVPETPKRKWPWSR